MNLVAGGTSYQLLIKPPTATTSAEIQTIQQGVNFNQNLTLQASGTGNVGIGITNPSSKLYVNGNTTINGDFIANNGITTGASVNNFLGGLRIKGTDTGSTIYNATNSQGLTCLNTVFF